MRHIKMVAFLGPPCICVQCWMECLQKHPGKKRWGIWLARVLSNNWHLAQP